MDVYWSVEQCRWEPCRCEPYAGVDARATSWWVPETVRPEPPQQREPEPAPVDA